MSTSTLSDAFTAASHFVGSWRLVQHDEGFKDYMKLQGINVILQKAAQIAPFHKNIRIRGGGDGSAFTFCDDTTIMKIVEIKDAYEFTGNGAKSETLKQHIKGDDYESVCWFERDTENHVTYCVDRVRKRGGLRLSFRVGLDISETWGDGDKRGKKMEAILTAEKDGKSAETRDTWERTS